MNKYMQLGLLFLPLVLIGCHQPVVTESYLLDYIKDKDNGLIVEKEKAGYKLSVIFKPVDLLIAQEIGDKNPTKKELNTLKNKYNNYSYFILSLSKDKKNALYNMNQGYSEFSKMLQTLAFRMDQHVELTTSEKDTIPVADFIYPRLYASSPTTDLLFVFNREKFKDAEWVQFNLDEFGLQTGRQRFRFNTSDILNTPVIEYQFLDKDKI